MTKKKVTTKKTTDKRAKKGQRFGGRAKGSPNKITTEIKEKYKEFLDFALNMTDDFTKENLVTKAWKDVAKNDPIQFLNLIHKFGTLMIPKDINLSNDDESLKPQVNIQTIKWAD